MKATNVHVLGVDHSHAPFLHADYADVANLDQAHEPFLDDDYADVADVVAQ